MVTANILNQRKAALTFRSSNPTTPKYYPPATFLHLDKLPFFEEVILLCIIDGYLCAP